MIINTTDDVDLFPTSLAIPRSCTVEYTPDDLESHIDTMEVTLEPKNGRPVEETYSIAATTSLRHIPLPDPKASGPTLMKVKFTSKGVLKWSIRKELNLLPPERIRLNETYTPESILVRTLPESNVLTLSDIRTEKALANLPFYAYTNPPDIPEIYETISSILDYFSDFQIKEPEVEGDYINVTSITEAMESKTADRYTLTLLAYAILDRLGYDAIAVMDRDCSFFGIKVKMLRTGQYRDMACHIRIPGFMTVIPPSEEFAMFDPLSKSFEDGATAALKICKSKDFGNNVCLKSYETDKSRYVRNNNGIRKRDRE